MEESLYLQKFTYTVPSSVLMFTDNREHYPAAEHLPLLKVLIDFGNGSFKLEGDWGYLVASNRHNENKCALYQRERVDIEMAIFHSLPINLNDAYSDGLFYSMQGSIKDGSCLTVCTGLLVIDKARSRNNLMSDSWTICFYLYDSQFEDCEIKSKLPLQIVHYNGNKN